MTKWNKLAYQVKRSGRVQRSVANRFKVGFGPVPLFLIVTMAACASSVSKEASNGGESHFLFSCKPKCEADLECICGVCTKICDSDDDCNDLPNAICVSPESLESVRECEPSDPVDKSVCDIGCSKDKDCETLGEDATCESGYCRFAEIERLNTKPDANTESDAGSEPVDSSVLNPSDAGETIDTAGSGSTDPEIEDPEERELNLSVISRYCSLIEQYPCLDWSTFLLNKGISINQSLEQKLKECELAMEIQVYQTIGEPCRELVREAMECQIQLDYACPCDSSSNVCQAPSLNGFPPEGEPCFDQLRAYDTCLGEQPDPIVEIVGDRAICVYYMSFTDPGDCRIDCSLEPNIVGGTSVEAYGAYCNGSPSGPLDCTCFTMEGNWLTDMRRPNYSVYGSDCSEVAQALADGKCIEILDCCFSWVDEEDGVQRCGCTSDLQSSSIGPSSSQDSTVITCEELAATANGEVVDICPGYDIGSPSVPYFW